MIKMRLIDKPRLKVELQIDPTHLCIGTFWAQTQLALHIYICLVPMFPLHIFFYNMGIPTEIPTEFLKT